MLAQVLFLALLLSRTGLRRGAQETEELEDENPLWRLMQTTVSRSLLILALVVTVFIGALWIGGEALTSRLETVSSEMTGQVGADRGGGGRKEIWAATWRMILDHPLTGVGFNGYWAIIPRYHQASGELTPQQAHNDYLELLASGGIIGVALVVWFFILFIKDVKRSSRSPDPFRRAARTGALTGLFGVAVHSAVDFGLHITINALIFTALVMIAILDDRVEDQESPVLQLEKQRPVATQS
jgi:O-antigen ligase